MSIINTAEIGKLKKNKLDLAGGTLTGNLSLGDNVKAIFGAGSDLQIYHDGASTSYLKASSDLFLQGTDDIVIRDASTLEEHIRCNLNDSVQIGYDGSWKLATTSTGIDVTGTVTADGVTSDGDLILASTGNIKSTGSIIYTVDSDNDQTNKKHYFRDGSGAERLVIDESGDISFYEDTGTTAKFFWDASAERLGLGTTSPDDAITIQASSGMIKMIDEQNTDVYHRIYSASNSSLTISADAGNANSGQLRFFTADTERMHIDSSGNVKLSGGNLEFSGGTNAAQYIKFGDTGDDDIGEIFYYHGNNNMVFTTNASEAMRIDSSGNVGIGQSSPSSPEGADKVLHIGDGTNAMASIVLQENENKWEMVANNDLIFQDESVVRQRIGAAGDITFYDSAQGEKVIIKNSGNVGIGTSSPEDKLSIHSKSHNYGYNPFSNHDADLGIHGPQDARSLEWVHGHGKSSNPTQTVMYSWYAWTISGGWSSSSIPGLLEVTAHISGKHASGAGVEKFSILIPNYHGASSSCGLSGAYVDKVYGLNLNSGAYTTSLSSTFYYKNNCTSHHGGTLYARFEHRAREPRFTLYSKYLGSSGGGYSPQFSFLGSDTTSASYDPGNHAALTIYSGGGTL